MPSSLILFLFLSLCTFILPPSPVSAVDLQRRQHSSSTISAHKHTRLVRKKKKGAPALQGGREHGHAHDESGPARSDDLSQVLEQKPDMTIGLAPEDSISDAPYLEPLASKAEVMSNKDQRSSSLSMMNDVLKHPEEYSSSKIRALTKERKQLTKEMISGDPDPGTDVKYMQVVAGVDRIGAGFDASDGTLKLPALVWKAYNGDECEPGKTGRWCNQASVDHDFFSKSLPAAIAATKETEAHSSVVRRVYTDTKDLATHEAEEMSFRSPVGVMTQEQDVAMLRDVQAHSDLMLARREQKLYTLKLYPFQARSAVDTAYVKSELVEAFLSTPSATNKDETEDTNSGPGLLTAIPDCMLHDCMIRDERDDIPSTGCLFEGMKVSVPTCEQLNTKAESNLKEGCKSKFFLSMAKDLQSKTYTTTKNPPCKDNAERNAARLAGPNEATCTAYGLDLGNVCNANDMKRLGQFVSRWGTHYVESASFGGEMEVSVQMRKDRGNHVVNDMTTRSTTDHGARTVDLSASSASALNGVLSDDANAAATLEPQSSFVRAEDAKSTTTATSNAGAINGVLDAMYASGVELGQEVRRARLSSNGIENIAISFVGGSAIPATENSVTRSEISKWSESIATSPALLRKSMSLRPLFEIIDHPSVHEALVKKSKVKKDGKTEEEDKEVVKKNLKKFTSVLARKKLLLENHLRWFMAKSEALGTALDATASARIKSEHQLRIMSRTVQDWVDVVLKEGTTGTTTASRTVDSIVRDSSSGLRGITAARTDQVQATLEEEKSQEMLTYVMQYRRAASKFEKYCKIKCDKENDAVHLKNVMYGRVRMSSTGSVDGKTAAPSGLSGDTLGKDITDSKFTSKRIRDRCLADCGNQKSISVHTSRNLMTAEQIEDQNLNGAVGTSYDLSTEAFFAGVQGACTVCNGMVRTVVSGSLPVLSGSAVDPRDICRNHLFAASNEDLSNPRSTEYNLDDDMANANSDSGSDEDDEANNVLDPSGSGELLNERTVRRHGTAICLGIVNELEDRMRHELQEHGFATALRDRLVDLVRLWKSHSKNSSPKKMGLSICKRFVQCTTDELTGGLDSEQSDNFLVAAKENAQRAQSAIARLENKITRIDKNMKLLPKAEQKKFEEKKKKLTEKVKEEKDTVKTSEKELKAAEENHKVMENEETEAEGFCHFDCLAATKWGKEYEKIHKNEMSAMSSRRPRDDIIVNRASRPCGIQIREPKEKKCSTCDNRDCMAEARKKCFMKGSVTKCDSRWMVLDGEYYDSFYPYQVNFRL